MPILADSLTDLTINVLVDSLTVLKVAALADSLTDLIINVLVDSKTVLKVVYLQTVSLIL